MLVDVIPFHSVMLLVFVIVRSYRTCEFNLERVNFSLLCLSCVSTNNCVMWNFVYLMKHKVLRIPPSVVGHHFLNFGLVVAALWNV